MAVTVSTLSTMVSGQTVTQGSSVATLTQSLTLAQGTSHLYVLVAQPYIGGVSSVTYNGNAMTQDFSQLSTVVEVGFIYEVQTGDRDGSPHDLTVTLPSARTWWAWQAIAISGAKAGNPLEGAQTLGPSSASSGAVTVTSKADDVVLGFGAWKNGAGANGVVVSVAGDTTSLGGTGNWLRDTGNDNGEYEFLMGYEVGAASVTLDFSADRTWDRYVRGANIQQSIVTGRAVFMFSKIRDFYDDLKRGLVPPQELQNRYREVFI